MSLDDPRIQTAKKLHADKSMAVSAICQTLQISRPTLYRWLAVKGPVGGPQHATNEAAASS
jgi:transposase-like protein